MAQCDTDMKQKTEIKNQTVLTRKGLNAQHKTKH